MFGVIVSGRLAQTDFLTVDTNKFLVTIPDADSINHIVVFMTGLTAFPPDMGASVYFSWPDPNVPPTWQLLGIISNGKPSAIYKITKLKGTGDVLTNGFGFVQPIITHVAQIGISIEPLSQIMSLTPTVTTEPMCNSFMSFTLKTAESLFNFVSSFSRTLPSTNEQIVPLASVQQWYQNYVRKLEMNPHFWKN